MVAIGIGASMLVAAQSLAKMAYSTRPEIVVITFLFSLCVLGLFSIWADTKKYFGFVFVLAAIYGAGHILYDLLNAFLKSQAPHFPVETHVQQLTVVLLSVGAAALLLVKRKK